MIIDCHNPLRTTIWSVLFVFIAFGAANGSHANTSAAPQSTILVVGDSISAAYGMSLQEGWVELLQRRLTEQDLGYAVVNASISGETSGGAAARLPALLDAHRPTIVVIELGGNDGLRGYPVKQLRANLGGMAEQSIAAGASVLLVGMEIPPNYGSRYTQQFRDSFPRVAEATGSTLVPFMLEGVATDPQLMQADGIHPTVAAQPLLLDNVWPSIEALIQAQSDHAEK